MPDTPVPSAATETSHWHRFGAFHRHHDWHGHCVGSTYSAAYVEHSCRRWHFHLPFTHRHTETGR